MIDWQTIDTVLLDMDGTLLDLHYDDHFWKTHLPRRYADIKKLDIEVSRKQLQDHINAIEGTLDWYCLDYWSESLGVNVSELHRETRHKINERPHAKEFLDALKDNDKAVYMVTNCHPDGIDLKLEETSIRPCFDRIISSHQFRYPKERPEFWQAFHSKYPFDRERTLFVDDNVTVLNAAVDFGIKHILGIHQPNSKRDRRLDQVPAIHHFNEILAGLIAKR